jgi:hypothetical protein
VTGASEVTGSVLLLWPLSAFFGALILLGVCSGTFLAQIGPLHGDLIHVFVLGSLLLLVAWLSRFELDTMRRLDGFRRFQRGLSSIRVGSLADMGSWPGSDIYLTGSQGFLRNGHTVTDHVSQDRGVSPSFRPRTTQTRSRTSRGINRAFTPIRRFGWPTLCSCGTPVAGTRYGRSTSPPARRRMRTWS